MLHLFSPQQYQFLFTAEQERTTPAYSVVAPPKGFIVVYEKPPMLQHFVLLRNYSLSNSSGHLGNLNVKVTAADPNMAFVNEVSTVSSYAILFEAVL